MAEPKQARPFLSSVRPTVMNGSRVTQAMCEMCGTIRGFHSTPKCRFPDSGMWTECRACGEYRFFFRIVRGKVVNERKWEWVNGKPTAVENAHAN